MRLLLDTHIALWAITDSPKLPRRARDLIAASENTICVSVASLWEIAIKHALKRRGARAMPVSAGEARGYFAAAGYAMLPIMAQHIETLETLPSLTSDPFDRILVAQALSEPLRLATHDDDLAGYGQMVMVL